MFTFGSRRWKTHHNLSRSLCGRKRGWNEWKTDRINFTVNQAWPALQSPRLQLGRDGAAMTEQMWGLNYRSRTFHLFFTISLSVAIPSRARPCPNDEGMGRLYQQTVSRTRSCFFPPVFFPTMCLQFVVASRLPRSVWLDWFVFTSRISCFFLDFSKLSWFICLVRWNVGVFLSLSGCMWLFRIWYVGWVLQYVSMISHTQVKFKEMKWVDQWNLRFHES